MDASERQPASDGINNTGYHTRMQPTAQEPKLHADDSPRSALTPRIVRLVLARLWTWRHPKQQRCNTSPAPIPRGNAIGRGGFSSENVQRHRHPSTLRLTMQAASLQVSGKLGCSLAQTPSNPSDIGTGHSATTGIPNRSPVAQVDYSEHAQHSIANYHQHGSVKPTRPGDTMHGSEYPFHAYGAQTGLHTTKTSMASLAPLTKFYGSAFDYWLFQEFPSVFTSTQYIISQAPNKIFLFDYTQTHTVSLATSSIYYNLFIMRFFAAVTTVLAVATSALAKHHKRCMPKGQVEKVVSNYQTLVGDIASLSEDDVAKILHPDFEDWSNSISAFFPKPYDVPTFDYSNFETSQRNARQMPIVVEDIVAFDCDTIVIIFNAMFPTPARGISVITVEKDSHKWKIVRVDVEFNSLAWMVGIGGGYQWQQPSGNLIEEGVINC
ncbi:uncharacterized protein MKZ38_004086 [Zalerion maritima]|uniref:NTF2-like domain-containing protein n=1 Tax=Zalerion maritima TaxID=339359 RepID=A0AAD5RWK8_9PEZI|nr:uncharacterized protein MKZ38_004086 [Zalerion maritima]